MIKPYGETTNKLVGIQDMIKVISNYNNRRHDIVVPRAGVTASPVTDTETGHEYLAFYFGDNTRDKFFPTNVAINQIADKARIPTEFLRQNAERYPDLATHMINTWLTDTDTINLVGTSRERKKKVSADNMKHLVRLFEPNGSSGVFRALLSSRYLVIDNIDAMSAVLDEIDKAGKKNAVDINGSLSESRMNIRVKIADISSTISFPDKGRGHKMINVPCGASLLYQNSDVGAGGFNIIPELEVYKCTNLLRATVSMRQIHIGGDISEMNFLSEGTIRKMNEVVMARARDVIRTVMTQGTFNELARLFSEHAGDTIENPKTVVENVTKKFAIPATFHENIFAKFMEEASEAGGPNRFALSQALTNQAVKLRKDDFESALAFEDAGSRVLTMTKDEFGRFEVSAKN